MPPRITNAVLAEKIENLKEYIVGHNETQNGRITLQEAKTEKNTVSIAGMKGASGVIAFVVSIVTTLTGIYFGMKR